MENGVHDEKRLSVLKHHPSLLLLPFSPKMSNCNPLRKETSYSPSFVLLQCLLLALYRILFPVFILTHCGTGRFLFIACASLRLMMNVLWEGILCLVGSFPC